MYYRNRTIDIVISRYEEDLSWLKNLPIKYSNLYIYNKGTPIDNIDLPNVRIFQLPNLGRESHTYFYHVVNNYYDLADMTFFLPGSVWATKDNLNNFFKRKKLFKIIDSIKTDFKSTITGSKNEVLINNIQDFTIDRHELTNEENKKKNSDSSLEKSKYRPLKTWFTKRFPGEKITCVSYHGTMAATRESIHKRPIEFYKILLDEHSVKNAEVVHYSERTWHSLFSIDKCLQDE